MTLECTLSKFLQITQTHNEKTESMKKLLEMLLDQAIVSVVRIGTTTIRALNLIMRSLLVPSSLAIGRIVCVVQAIAMTVGWLGISTSL